MRNATAFSSCQSCRCSGVTSSCAICCRRCRWTRSSGCFRVRVSPTPRSTQLFGSRYRGSIQGAAGTCSTRNSRRPRATDERVRDGVDRRRRDGWLRQGNLYRQCPVAASRPIRSAMPNLREWVYREVPLDQLIDPVTRTSKVLMRKYIATRFDDLPYVSRKKGSFRFDLCGLAKPTVRTGPYAYAVAGAGRAARCGPVGWSVIGGCLGQQIPRIQVLSAGGGASVDRLPTGRAMRREKCRMTHQDRERTQCRCRQRRRFVRGGVCRAGCRVALGAAGVAAACRRRSDPRSPGTGAWQRRVVNVRDKGARGDGEHDDTAAFQAAIDALPSAAAPSRCLRART